MSCDIRIAVIGGDKRLMYMAQKLAESECFVTTHLVENESCLKDVRTARSLQEALAEAQVVITPVPFSRDGVHIFKNLIGVVYEGIFPFYQRKSDYIWRKYSESGKGRNQEKKSHFF